MAKSSAQMSALNALLAMPGRQLVTVLPEGGAVLQRSTAEAGRGRSGRG